MAKTAQEINQEYNLLAVMESDTTLKRSGSWYLGPCPFCGGTDRFTSRETEKGWIWNCRYCTPGRYHRAVDYIMRRENVDFPAAMRKLNQGELATIEKRQPTTHQAQQTPARWRENPSYWLEQFTSHPHRLQWWQAYKPIQPGRLIELAWGVGKLPAAKWEVNNRVYTCPHNRLVIPVFDKGRLVALRGRAIDEKIATKAGIHFEGCTCAKWLPAGGTPFDELPLFGEYNLTAGRKIGWIVENLVDSEMVFERTPDGVGLAIYSTSYTRHFENAGRWYQAVVESGIKEWIIALDNDLVGNGGADRRAEFIHDFQVKAQQAWIKKHPGQKAPALETFNPPEPAALKIFRALRGTGLNVTIFPWGNAEHKADIAGLLMQETEAENYVQKSTATLQELPGGF